MLPHLVRAESMSKTSLAKCFLCFWMLGMSTCRGHSGGGGSRGRPGGVKGAAGVGETVTVSPQRPHTGAPPRLSQSGAQTGGAPGPASPPCPRTASASSCAWRPIGGGAKLITKSDSSCACVCACDLPQERVVPQHRSALDHALGQDGQR